MEPNNEQNLLQDLEHEMFSEPASRWSRFGNLIVDSIAIYLINRALLTATNYITWFIPNFDESLALEYRFQLIGISMLANAVLQIFYYTIFESAAGGRTLGKMVTRTVARRDNGQPLTTKDAFLRSLCRLIPFNGLSALFAYRPWHDSIPKTMVVNIR